MKILHPDLLSLDPIPMPTPVDRAPEGIRVDLPEIVRDAGMRCVVTDPGGPVIRIITGDRDVLYRRPGIRMYGIGEANIPEEPKARAREILRRLAYAFHDWAAREVVARYHRDLRRTEDTRLRVPVVDRLMAVLRLEDGATVGRLSRATGIPQPNVSRAVRALSARNVVRVERSGRESLVFLIADGAGAAIPEGAGPGA